MRTRAIEWIDLVKLLHANGITPQQAVEWLGCGVLFLEDDHEHIGLRIAIDKWKENSNHVT